MKRSKRLSAIVDLHQHQEDAALQALGVSQRRLHDQQQQLEQLENYRLDYLKRFAEQQRNGLNVGQMLEFRAFADKLDKAIQGQILAVQNVEREVQRARLNWEQSHQRTQSLQKVTDIALKEEAHIEDKREQAEQDARAARSSKRF